MWRKIVALSIGLSVSVGSALLVPQGWAVPVALVVFAPFGVLLRMCNARRAADRC